MVFLVEGGFGSCWGGAGMALGATGMAAGVGRADRMATFLVSSCHDATDKKERKRRRCHFFIYEREELASYIPVAKLFLRSHTSASGGVQLPCSPAGCSPARCRSGEVRPVRCCFSLVPPGNTRLRVTAH